MNEQNTIPPDVKPGIMRVFDKQYDKGSADHATELNKLDHAWSTLHGPEPGDRERSPDPPLKSLRDWTAQATDGVLTMVDPREGSTFTVPLSAWDGHDPDNTILEFGFIELNPAIYDGVTRPLPPADAPIQL